MGESPQPKMGSPLYRIIDRPQHVLGSVVEEAGDALRIELGTSDDANPRVNPPLRADTSIGARSAGAQIIGCAASPYSA
jgi:hypothetical protein